MSILRRNLKFFRSMNSATSDHQSNQIESNRNAKQEENAERIETTQQYSDANNHFEYEVSQLRRNVRGWVMWCVTWFFLFCICAACLFFLFVVVKNQKGPDYDYSKGFVCDQILGAPDCIIIIDGGGSSNLQKGESTLTDLTILRHWIERINPRFVLPNKVEALDVNYSIISESDLNTGNVLLGLYEENRSRTEGNRARVEAGIHYLLAGANGDYDARELYEDLRLSLDQRKAAQKAFEDLHVLNGAEGYLRLAQMYLGYPAMDQTTNGFPFDAPPRFISHRNDYPNNFLTDTPQYAKAYEAAHKAVKCNHPDSLQWREYIAGVGGLSRSEQDRLKISAQRELDVIAERTINGIEDHCDGITFRQRINRISDSAVISRMLVDRRSWPPIQDMVYNISLPEPDFDRWIGVLIREPIGNGSRGSNFGDAWGSPGSQYYRNSPGAAAVDPAAPGASDRRDNLRCDDNSAAALAAGDAYLRSGETREAQRFYQRALDEGRRCAAPSADKALKRLAALNLPCEYNIESLNRISRDVSSNDTVDDGGGSVIKLRARQKALSAHGYYKGKIDGRYGDGTRAAVKQFQRDFAFDETGDLTPIETVYLICSAATVKSDVSSKTTLGVMNLTGLGVIQNTEAGRRYLEDAATSGDRDAAFNLATIFGLGTITSSYRLCGIPENLARADFWLEKAADYGHPRANLLIDRYQNDSPSDRWEKYERDLLRDGFFKDRLINAPEACTPNP